MKDLLNKLSQLSQTTTSINEGTTIPTATGRIHKGTYGSSYDPEVSDGDSAPAKKGRGRPKKDLEAGETGKKYDFSAFTTPVKLKDKLPSKVHRIEEDGESEVTESVDPSEIGVTPVQLIDLLKLAGITNSASPVPASPVIPSAEVVPPVADVDPVTSMEPMSMEIDGGMSDLDNDTKLLPEDGDEYSNSPDEKYGKLSDIIANGDDLHRPKGTYPNVPDGDNPMQPIKERAKSIIEKDLWERYEQFVNRAHNESSDYSRRRQREEDIISGKSPARKKAPSQTSDYARRREQGKKKLTNETQDSSFIKHLKIRENTGVTDYSGKNSHGMTRKDALALWHKTHDPKYAELALKMGASQSELKSMDEGIVDNIRAMNYDRLARRSASKSSAALDRAMDYDFSDENRFDDEAEFSKHAKIRDQRTRKAAELRHGGPITIDDQYIDKLASIIKAKGMEEELPSRIVDYARTLTAKKFSDVHARSFWIDSDVDDISANARKLLAKVYNVQPEEIGYNGGKNIGENMGEYHGDEDEISAARYRFQRDREEYRADNRDEYDPYEDEDDLRENNVEHMKIAMALDDMVLSGDDYDEACAVVAKRFNLTPQQVSDIYDAWDGSEPEGVIDDEEDEFTFTPNFGFSALRAMDESLGDTIKNVYHKMTGSNSNSAPKHVVDALKKFKKLRQIYWDLKGPRNQVGQRGSDSHNALVAANRAYHEFKKLADDAGFELDGFEQLRVKKAPKQQTRESDISGLMHAARNLNNQYRIRVATPDGKQKYFKVKAQSERVAKEKMMKHIPDGKIVGIEDITDGGSKQGVAEGVNKIQELSKGTLEKYKSKAKAQAKTARYYGTYGDPDDPQDVKDQYHKFADKREAGVKKANARLKKEDSTLSEMSNISEGASRVYDLRAEHVPDSAIPKIKSDFAAAGIKLYGIELDYETGERIISIGGTPKTAKKARDIIWNYNNGLYVGGLSEGVVDTIKRGVKRSVKNIKRGIQGWGQTDLPITGDKNKPKDVVKLNKSYDDDTVKRLHKAATTQRDTDFPLRKRDLDGKDKHSPAGLQKRVLDREMKKRGLDQQSVSEGSGYPEVDHMPGKRGIGLDSAKPKDTHVKTFHASKEKEAHEFAKKHGHIVKKHVYPKSANNSQPHEFQVHKNVKESNEGYSSYQGKGNHQEVEAYGVKGSKSTPWRKKFKNQEAFEKWLEQNEGDVEVHGTRKAK